MWIARTATYSILMHTTTIFLWQRNAFIIFAEFIRTPYRSGSLRGLTPRVHINKRTLNPLSYIRWRIAHAQTVNKYPNYECTESHEQFHRAAVCIYDDEEQRYTSHIFRYRWCNELIRRSWMSKIRHITYTMLYNYPIYVNIFWAYGSQRKYNSFANTRCSRYVI